MTNDPADAHEPVEPEDAHGDVEGPLDPFDDGVPLASGPDDVGFLRMPSAAQRAMSAMVDFVIAGLIFTIGDLIIISAFTTPGHVITAAQNRTVGLYVNLIPLLLTVFYVLLVGYTGKSTGQRITRLRLVMLDGTKPSWIRLIVRYGILFGLGSRGLAGLSLAVIGVLYSAFQVQRRSAFDMVAGTRLVADR